MVLPQTQRRLKPAVFFQPELFVDKKQASN